MAGKAKEDTREQRDIDRDEELARQKAVTDAVAAHELAEREAAEKALADQQYYEVHGIRKVEGKP